MATKNNELPDWAKLIDPLPLWAASDVADAGTSRTRWQVETRYWGYEWPTGPVGPREVLVRLLDDGTSPATLRRGVTSGHLSRSGATLIEMVDSFDGLPIGHRESTGFQIDEFVATDPETFENEWRTSLERRAKAMPKGPRGNADAYYWALLGLYNDCREVSTQPFVDLANALGIPRDTVRTRVARAKELAPSLYAKFSQGRTPPGRF